MEKVPGLYGYNSTFFKTAWIVVGPDWLESVRHYFNTSEPIYAFNSTCVTLVPKCSNLNLVKEFLPVVILLYTNVSQRCLQID